MVVGSLRITLRLHASHSLKDKRKPRRMLTDRIRARFKVAVSEVDDQDLWNVITLGIATVGPDKAPVEAVLRAIGEFIEESGEGEVIDHRFEFERY